ncbi:MAG: Uma2 family endonuclease [Cyanobacteria bacterium J06581_3]
MTPPVAITNTPTVEASSKDRVSDEHVLIDELAEESAAQLPSDLYSDEPPLETTLHLRQMMLLLNCLDWIWKDREDYFAAGNLTVYYSPRKRKDEDFRGPDFFVALDTQPHPRKSWMVWEEDGKYPNVIVELLSDSTADVDRDLKKRLYAETFRTPEYFWFDPDPESLEFKGFALVRGKYQPIDTTKEGWLWSEQLQLHLGVYDSQLRFFEPNGDLVPTPDEAAILAVEKTVAAEETAATAEKALISEQQNSAKLAEKLRELGIDPDTI